MKIAGHDIGVCSWSLQPTDTPDLIQRVKQLGLSHLQLGVPRLTTLDEKRKAAEISAIKSSGLSLTATMIGFAGEDYSTIASIRKTGGYVADSEYPIRRQITKAAGRITRELGVDKISAHVGFVPPSSDPNYQVMVTRVGEIAADLAEIGLTFVLETGQETANELLQFLNDLRSSTVKVNFDPANMILYGAGDPIDAIKTLGRHIGHVHVKDATLSDAPGSKWGEEVPFGAGQVPPKDFLRALEDVGYTGPLVIEREAGVTRMEDVAIAIESLKKAST